MRAAIAASKAADYLLGFLSRRRADAIAPNRRRHDRVLPHGGAAVTQSRICAMRLRLCGSAASESERAAPVFVTGWRSRESLSAARRGEPTWQLPFRRSPSVAVARHSLQQAGALSQSNVRRVKAGVSIEELAEDIARRTLAAEPQRPAGARRRRRRDRHVRDPGRRPPLPRARTAGEAEAPGARPRPSPASCATRRHSPRRIRSPRTSSASALHPLDQFRAFQTLREQGLSEEEIAAASSSRRRS